MMAREEERTAEFASAMGDGPSGMNRARHQPRPSAGSHLQPRGHVVIFLPALNEEQSIGGVLERIPRDQLESAGYNVSVWVVDGNSTDRTLDVVRESGASAFVQDGRGKGRGMRQAFEHLLATRDWADGGSRDPEFFLMLDADGTYPVESVPEFVEELARGNDVVLGSRFRGRMEDGAMTSLNAIGNRVLSAIAHWLYGVPVTDVCTGMWGLNAEALRQIPLVADGFDLEADLFGSACRSNARIRELPIDYGRRVGSSRMLPLQSGLKIAWRLFLGRINAVQPKKASSPSHYVSPEPTAS